MFNLYFAGARSKMDEHIIKRKACRLYSYANDKKAIELFCQNESRGPLLVDSGAFSVAHSGAVVDIDSYIEYINNNRQIENFIELDVIPYPSLTKQTALVSAQKSWENYLYMIERLDEPFKLLPVFHFGEDLSFFEQIVNYKNSNNDFVPYICIGGRHGVSMDIQERYFERLFSIIHTSANPEVKVHVLGMTVFSTLEKFPFYSADSTSYLLQAAYGGIQTSLGVINVSAKNKHNDNFRYRSKHEQAAILEKIHFLGYDLDVLSTCHKERIKYNIDYCLDWAKNYVYKGKKSFKDSSRLF